MQVCSIWAFSCEPILCRGNLGAWMSAAAGWCARQCLGGMSNWATHQCICQGKDKLFPQSLPIGSTAHSYVLELPRLARRLAGSASGPPGVLVCLHMQRLEMQHMHQKLCRHFVLVCWSSV